MNIAELADEAAATRRLASATAGRLLEQRPGWQEDNRILHRFWEEAIGGAFPSRLNMLNAHQQRQLRDAMLGLESQAEAARKDLLRVQHAAGAIAHALKHA